MSEFTASNGIKVLTDGRTRAEYDCSHGEEPHVATAAEMEALREFFVKENDDRLGRWRWPENPDYIVYPDSLNTTPPVGAIRVWNERNGVSRRYLNRDGVDGVGGKFDDAAAAFFDAHPEPKPWDDAKPGEVWRFETTDDRRHALGWVAGEGTWDLLTPRGESVIGVADPMAYLLETWGDEFEGATATRFVPEVQS